MNALVCAVAALACCVSQPGAREPVAPAAALELPERGCGSVAIYLYFKTIGVSVDYSRCVELLEEPTGAASLQAMERASAALGKPLVARTVGAVEFAAVREPVILLTVPAFSIRGSREEILRIGHYVVAEPVGTSDWLVYDFPASKPSKIDAAGLWRRLGVQADRDAIVMSASTPRSRLPAVEVPGHYADSTSLDGGQVGVEHAKEIGLVEMPISGSKATVESDLSGLWIGDRVRFSLHIRNPGERAIVLSVASASCSCARISVPAPRVEHGGVVECVGEVTLNTDLSRRAEWADLAAHFEDDGTPAGSVRVEFRGSLRVRAIVEPPVTAFGRVVETDAVAPIRVRVRQATAGRYEIVEPVPAPFIASIVDQSSAGEVLIDVSVDPGAAGFSTHRAKLKVADPARPQLVTEIPLEVTLVPAVRANPHAAVLSHDSPAVSVSFQAENAVAVTLLSVEDLVGVETVIGPTGRGGSVELRVKAGTRPPRVQHARVRFQFEEGRPALELSFVVIVR